MIAPVADHYNNVEHGVHIKNYFVIHQLFWKQEM